MSMRRTVTRVAGMAGIATVLTASAIVLPFGGAAFATPAVSLSAGPYTDGQSITVSGTGFPNHAALPSGLSIIECSDPGGLVSNLPTDSSTCDGSTANPLPVNTDASGNFSTSYALALLTPSGGSPITCDATHFCVLWVGADFVNSFTGTHAFSTPFEISSPTTGTPEAPVAIALPIGAAILVGGMIFVARRRRSSPAT